MGDSDIFKEIAEVVLDNPVAGQAYISSVRKEISFNEALAIMVVHFWRENQKLKRNLMRNILGQASPYPVPNFGE